VNTYQKRKLLLGTHVRDRWMGNVVYTDTLYKQISTVGWKSFHGWFQRNIPELRIKTLEWVGGGRRMLNGS